jgi:glycosyltransferase involved in cell wall biosynthesis
MMAPLLLHVFATFAVGGAQARFAAIANRFGRRWRHAIVAMDGNTTCRERLSPQLDVLFPNVGVRKGDTLDNVRHFRAALKALQPDLLVTGNWGSIEWAMANLLPHAIPHLHIEDGFGPEERDRQIRRRVLMRRLVLRRSAVVVPSRVLWQLATRVWRLDPRRVRHVPNGIDLSRFGPQERHDGMVIGTVAALLAGDLPASMVIVGDGPERGSLEGLAAELGVAGRVRFAGHKVQPAKEYAGFDVFALSSDTEQMPLSVLEAMAAGLPVAATDVGDVRDMLAEANGPYVVQKDDAAMAEALRRLLTNPDLRLRLSVANRTKAERDYDQERMFATYAEVFDLCMAS